MPASQVKTANNRTSIPYTVPLQGVVNGNNGAGYQYSITAPSPIHSYHFTYWSNPTNLIINNINVHGNVLSFTYDSEGIVGTSFDETVTIAIET